MLHKQITCDETNLKQYATYSKKGVTSIDKCASIISESIITINYFCQQTDLLYFKTKNHEKVISILLSLCCEYSGICR